MMVMQKNVTAGQQAKIKGLSWNALRGRGVPGAILSRRANKKSCLAGPDVLWCTTRMEVERALVALPDFKSGAPG